jgi:hypothetical protein
MKPKQGKYTAFYTYMEPFLEKGNEAMIIQAKKAYRRAYKARWRKQKRGISMEITTIWEKEEYKLLKAEAKRHKESITKFIKRATMAYMDKRYVVPNEEQVMKVMQLLALTYNSIGELIEDTLLSSDIAKKLQADVFTLERDIRIVLFSPKTIEQTIIELIYEKPALKQQLITCLETLQA